MSRLDAPGDVRDLLSAWVTDAYGNHLRWGDLLAHEFDRERAVWRVTFTTRENVWQEDYEQFEHEAEIDAVDGAILHCRPLGKRVSAADLYRDEIAEQLRERL